MSTERNCYIFELVNVETGHKTLSTPVAGDHEAQARIVLAVNLIKDRTGYRVGDLYSVNGVKV